jgi:hypothetical protein
LEGLCQNTLSATAPRILLLYIIDMNLRKRITATTNKVEAFNGFISWIRFGGEGIISTNNPIEQEKRIKYSEIIANAIILYNIVYMTIAINKLLKEGYSISKSDLSDLSPYITKHIKRFGDYYINVNLIPVPIQNRLFANLFNK